MYITAMTMKLRTIVPVVSLIAIALAGLILLQVYLLNNAFVLKEQAFRQNVGTALGAAALKLQAGETLSRVLRYDFTSGSPPLWNMKTNPSSSFPVRVSGNSLSYHVGSPQRVSIRVVNNEGSDSLLSDTLRQPGNYTVSLDTALSKKRGDYYRFVTDSASMVVSVGGHTPGEEVHGMADMDRLFVVSTVYNDLLSEGKGIGMKVNPVLLDSVLKGSMHDAGIPLDFSYGMLSSRRDSVIMANPVSAAAELRSSEFHVPLFRLAFGPPQGELAVYFSGRNAYLFGQLWPALGASVLFILIIALCFAYTVRTILRQQQLAGHMVEFINNMTHEFKTPIATVTLASEAIRRPDIIRNSTRVRKYNGMIAEETLRMKKQVDRILQMAVIEEGDYELSLSDVDMHSVIQTAVDNAALRVESRGGNIAFAPGAVRHTVRGDTMHLVNIVHNLLDNAVKYSRAAPVIHVSTANDGTWLVVRVSDRGIGIPPEHIGRVFDKYYRVPTGNLHDVRGFGLGLSYVKLLVEAHGGAITLGSRQGEGTDVELKFPGDPSL
jgi:two-component system phosphate regulon sensor histidine kinase PhoR